MKRYLTRLLFVLAAMAIVLFPSAGALAANCGNDKPSGKADCSPGGPISNPPGNAGPGSSSNASAQAGAVAGAVAGSVATGGRAIATGGRATGGNASAAGGAGGQGGQGGAGGQGGIGHGGAGGIGQGGNAVSSAQGGQGGNATAAGGLGGIGQGGSATGGSLQSEINVSVSAPAQPADTTTRVVNEGTATVKTAPDVFVAGPASGPCTGISGGVSASWLGGGLGFSAASVDDACTRRENIRVLSLILPTLKGGDAEEVRALIMQLVRKMDPPKQANTAP